ncbi:RNA-binding RNA processing protein rpp1 [Lecanora helva]
MYYDLNVPYTANLSELQRRVAFLAEFVGYNTIALDHSITGKVPGEITNQIPSPLPFDIPPKLRILRRCTLHLSDPSQNHRLSSLASAYDILALRPTNEKSVLQACQALECDIISLDISQRFPFWFKHTTFANALQRGIKIELCYAAGVLNADGGASRRNLISNATQIIRATRGRGLIISSEAKSALACRAPADVVNMAVLWGLGQERGMEAVGREARSAAMQAEMKRRSFRGVIDVIYGGEKTERSAAEEKMNEGQKANGKRKASAIEENLPAKPISKREQKRQANKARAENAKAQEKTGSKGMEKPDPSITATPCPDGEHK